MAYYDDDDDDDDFPCNKGFARNKSGENMESEIAIQLSTLSRRITSILTLIYLHCYEIEILRMVKYCI
jgi:hypothetical protein